MTALDYTLPVASWTVCFQANRHVSLSPKDSFNLNLLSHQGQL